MFEGKVDDVTRALVTSAAGRRWTATRDLADAIERLSEIAVVAVGRHRTPTGWPTSCSCSARRSGPTPTSATRWPTRPARPTDKAALLDSLLGGKALPATVALAKQALGGTYRTMTGALAAYREVAAEAKRRGRRDGARRPAARATPTGTGWPRRCRSSTGEQVHLNEIVDPDVLGGMRVEIGDDVIDGTVSQPPRRRAPQAGRLTGSTTETD